MEIGILELHKDIREVPWDPCGLKDGNSEVKLLPFCKMFLGRSQSGHKLQYNKIEILPIRAGGEILVNFFSLSEIIPAIKYCNTCMLQCVQMT